MRHLLIALLTIIFAAVAAPATAAIVIHVDATVTGTTTDYTNCPNFVCAISPFTGDLSFTTVIDQFINGEATFMDGSIYSAGFKQGTVIDLGNGDLTGENLLYVYSATGPGAPGQITMASAERFAVTQLVPVPVPEPATWAMMILGFGVIGCGLRFRRSPRTPICV